MDPIPTYSYWQTRPDCDKTIFKHPSSILVVGSSESGKTHWVVSLLKEKDTRIVPTPDWIVYCYSHWQPIHGEPRRLYPWIRFQHGLSSSLFVNQLEDTLVVIDDLWQEALRDPIVMDIFTKGSQFRNLSVVLMAPNLIRGDTVRMSQRIRLNTQYIVLFRNPRDTFQLTELAKQIFPKKMAHLSSLLRTIHISALWTCGS